MTTPAINRNITTANNTDGYYVSREFDASNHLVAGPNTIFTGPGNIKWDRESRPASGNAGFNPSINFRLCRPWNHSSLLVERNWQSEEVISKVIIPPNHTVEKRYSKGSFWGGNVYSPASAPVFPTQLIARAELKALERLKDQKIHLGNFLAEGGKTLQMVGDAMSSIASSVKKFRRRNPARTWADVKRFQTGSKRFIAKIPDNWLQLQYGWKPLMSDVYGAINEIYDKQSRGAVFRVTATAHQDDLVDRKVSSLQDANSYCRIEQQSRHKCHVSLWYKLANNQLREVSTLGLINPAEIVWECTPFSFVVDWFTPVSSWLSALTADQGFTFVSGSQSRKTTYRESLNGVFFEQTPTHFVSGDGPAITGPGGENFTRLCYASTPVPGLYFKNPLSVILVLNSLALLRQAFK